MQDSKELEEDLLDLEYGTSIKMIYKNRSKKGSTITRYNNPKRGGGVVIAFNKSRIDLAEHKIENNKFELVAAKGRQFKSGRMIFIFGMSVQPKMKVAEFDSSCECIIEAINVA